MDMLRLADRGRVERLGGGEGVGSGGECRERRRCRVVAASHVNRVPKYLGALPAGPNDRYGMFVPRLLLQLTQLSPGLMRSGGSCGGGLISTTIKSHLSQRGG